LVLRPYYAHRSAWDQEAAGDHDLDPKGLIGLINSETQGKLHIHGHGLLKQWILENHQELDVLQLDGLANSGAYPVITTVSCHTGRFDDVDDPSVVEQMIRLDQAGAVAVIAPSREGRAVFKNRADLQRMVQEGLMDGTTRLMTEFWQRGLKDNLTIGEALAQARQHEVDSDEGYIGQHWLLSGVNLLGDPTLPVRNADPLTATLELPESLAADAEMALTITTGVAGATVCAWQADGLYEVATCDEAGVATLTLKPSKGEAVLVTVSGPMTNVVQGSIAVH
jgi:hypothetical protein